MRTTNQAKRQSARRGRPTTAAVAALSFVAFVGCNGDGPPAKDPSGQTLTDSQGQAISVAAAGKFRDALTALSEHDAKNDWTDAICDSTAKIFEDAAAEQGDKTFFEALYNAGVAHQRCKHDDKAKAIFSSLLEKNPKFHRARVQVALYDFVSSGGKDVDAAIGQMNQAIKDAEFKNEEALVHLAMLQMQRDNDVKDQDGDNDHDRAKKNLQRALAINDSFMPAFNQLAVYYLQSAKKKAGRKKGTLDMAAGAQKKADTQALELAALVCSQALRKNPSYAPVYNTSGLVSSELGDLSAAARAFGQARQLDSKFFEAHMNYAAVNLKFRGFQRAEEGYKIALQLRPGDYEAHLGLALAIRGQITEANWDQGIASASRELEAAKQVAPDRPETYYNMAILTEEFKAQGDAIKMEGVLREAQKLYKTFIDKAGRAEHFADAVKRSQERMSDIDVKIDFAKRSAEDQRQMEEMLRREEAAKAVGGTPTQP